MLEQITYFEKPGKDNTAEVLGLVRERAAKEGINKIVIASTRGETAKAAAQAVEGTALRMTVIPWQYYFRDIRQQFPENLIDEIQSKGHRVHFGTMLFHTADLYGNQTPTLMASVLRIFGQGIKVCVEITMMATDGGCLEQGEKIIAVAGTGSGADTAVIATAAPSSKFQTLRIHQIICKPL
jgi:uncharacterized protein